MPEVKLVPASQQLKMMLASLIWMAIRTDRDTCHTHRFLKIEYRAVTYLSHPNRVTSLPDLLIPPIQISRARVPPALLSNYSLMSSPTFVTVSQPFKLMLAALLWSAICTDKQTSYVMHHLFSSQEVIQSCLDTIQLECAANLVDIFNAETLDSTTPPYRILLYYSGSNYSLDNAPLGCVCPGS